MFGYLTFPFRDIHILLFIFVTYLWLFFTLRTLKDLHLISRYKYMWKAFSTFSITLCIHISYLWRENRQAFLDRLWFNIELSTIKKSIYQNCFRNTYLHFTYSAIYGVTWTMRIVHFNDYQHRRIHMYVAACKRLSVSFIEKM